MSHSDVMLVRTLVQRSHVSAEAPQSIESTQLMEHRSEPTWGLLIIHQLMKPLQAVVLDEGQGQGIAVVGLHTHTHTHSQSFCHYSTLVKRAVCYLTVITGLKPILSFSPQLFHPLLALVQEETHQPLIGRNGHCS